MVHLSDIIELEVSVLSDLTAENIKHYRKKKHITQTDLADAVGVSQMSIRRYETKGAGNREPSADLFDKIADILGTSANVLRGKIEEGQDVNIVEPDIDKLREEYQDLCYSLTVEELQIMIKIAYAFIKSHSCKDTE